MSFEHDLGEESRKVADRKLEDPSVKCQNLDLYRR